MSRLRVNQLMARDGAGAIQIAAGSRVQGSDPGSIVAPGQVVQVRSVRTQPLPYTISAQDIAAIPELSITITPIFANSKMLLTAMLNTNGRHVSTLGFLKGGVPVITNSNNNSNGSIATVYYGFDSASLAYNQYIEFLDDVASLAPITYQAAGSASWAGVIRPFIINDRTESDMRSVSSMTIYEIAQ